MSTPESWIAAFDESRKLERRPRQLRREKGWDQRHHTVACGNNMEKPKLQRSYFDKVFNEPKRPIEYQTAPNHWDGVLEDVIEQCKIPRRQDWVDGFWMDCSTDNEGLNPALRHYFDRRGLESSFRQRPEVDRTAPVLPPKSPRVPFPRAAKMQLKDGPSMHWGNRCLKYGHDVKAKTSDGSKILWVGDHQVTETVDNNDIHPKLRHYFDTDGLPSSFKNRGRHYGRGIPLHPFNGTLRVDPKQRETFSRSMSSVSLPAGPTLLGGEDSPWGRGAGEVLSPTDSRAPGATQLWAPAGADAPWDDHWWWDAPSRRRPYSHGPQESQKVLTRGQVSYPSLTLRNGNL